MYNMYLWGEDECNLNVFKNKCFMTALRKTLMVTI